MNNRYSGEMSKQVRRRRFITRTDHDESENEWVSGTVGGIIMKVYKKKDYYRYIRRK